jgi:hypothetical protein
MLRSHISFVFFFLSVGFFFSCSVESTRDESIYSEITSARELVYLNRLEDAEAILLQLDTSNLDAGERAELFLTKGFLRHELGDRPEALIYLAKASELITQLNDESLTAEWNLINAFIFEELMLRSEASKSYFKAYKYYKGIEASDKLLFALLGIARTSPDGEKYLEISEDVLKEVSSNRNELLYLNARATLVFDVRKRNNITLNSLKYFDDDYDLKKQIYIYSGIALNYQLLDQVDSALFYLNLSQDLIDKNQLAPERILHYYNIKAFIESSNTLTNKARETLDILFEHGKENPGILSQAFLRRSLIMKNTGQYANAYSDLREYTKLLRTEHATEQKYQLGLLSIQYQLQQKELQLAKVRFDWLITSSILLLTILMLGFVFYISRERLKRKKREYELKFKKTNKLLNEQVEESIKEAQMPHGNHIEDQRTESKLQEFGVFFRINHPLFREKLQKAHPSLTLNDIKHCECILAGLTVFQTERLLEVTEGAVKKARKKLRYILQCKSTHELFQYLQNIEDIE